MDVAGQAARKAFDAIDANNIGLAEVTVENGLKKFPQHHALLAADALLQYRNGKLEAARERATGLAEREDLRDPMAIDSLAHVLQQVGGWTPLATMYKRVAAQLPDSINVHENLFQTYVRMGSFVEAQRVALSLHKKTGGTAKHQVWAVLAMLAQVPPSSTDHLLLKLSTKLLESSVLTSSGATTSETTKAYVDVLIQQQRFDDALAFLQSARGAKVGLVERRLEIVRSILLLQGNTTAAAAIAKQLWLLASDDWRYFLWYAEYISTCEEGKQGATAAAAPEVVVLEDANAAGAATEAGSSSAAMRIQLNTCDTTFQAGLAVARHLQSIEATTRSNKMRRGPFLAELELLKRQIALQGTGEGLLTTLRDAASQYCVAFGTKPVCFMDVAPYLRVANDVDGSAAPVAEAVFAWCQATKQQQQPELSDSSSNNDISGATPSTTRKTLRYYQADMLERKCRQLTYDPTVPRSSSEVLQDMHACQTLYDASLALSSALEWSEEGLCDGYLSCAMTLGIRQYAATRDTIWLMHALETFRTSKRALNNPSWLMVAVQMQRLLGVVDTKLMKQLDFKSVQFDSMYSIGHAPLAEGGALKECEAWHREANKFYGSMGKETSRLRVKVFQFFTWPMWKDLVGFEAQLDSSVVRLETIAAFALSGIRCCQTQRDLFLHVEGVACDVRRALEFAASSPALIHSNEDTTVMRAVLVEDVQSARCATLVAALLGRSTTADTQPTEAAAAAATTISARVSRAKDKLALFCVVHDHVVRELTRQQQKTQQAPKSKKPQSSSAAVEGPTAMPVLPMVSAFRASVDGASWPSPIAPLMRCLVASLGTSGDVPSSDAWAAAIEGTAAALTAAVAEGPTQAMLDAVPWCVYVLSALLQGANAQVMPVARLADALKVVQVAWRAALDDWRRDACLGNPALAVAGEVSPLLLNDLLALQQHKLHQVEALLLGDLTACCTAASKRR